MIPLFKKYVFAQFGKKRWNSAQQIAAEELLEELIKHNLIPEKERLRFSVIEEFKRQYPLHEGHKTQTVYTISHKFNVSERTVWTILKDQKYAVFFFIFTSFKIKV